MRGRRGLFPFERCPRYRQLVADPPLQANQGTKPQQIWCGSLFGMRSGASSEAIQISEAQIGQPHTKRCGGLVEQEGGGRKGKPGTHCTPPAAGRWSRRTPPLPPAAPAGGSGRGRCRRHSPSARPVWEAHSFTGTGRVWAVQWNGGAEGDVMGNGHGAGTGKGWMAGEWAMQKCPGNIT